MKTFFTCIVLLSIAFAGCASQPSPKAVLAVIPNVVVLTKVCVTTAPNLDRTNVTLPPGDYKLRFKQENPDTKKAFYFYMRDDDQSVTVDESGAPPRARGGIVYSTWDGNWRSFWYRKPNSVTPLGPIVLYNNDRTEIPKIAGPLPDDIVSSLEKEANQALVPTPASVTPAADAPVAPDAGAAHL